MAERTSYSFYRYQFLQFDDSLDTSQQLELLEGLRGITVAHRKTDPSPDDLDTFIMQPALKEILDHRILTWCIARSIQERNIARYDNRQDEIHEHLIETDEIRYTKFVAIPMLGVLAIDSRGSDRHLGADGARSRLQSVVKSRQGHRVLINPAGDPQDLKRALDTWELDVFSFTVRPFNPSTSNPGRKLHQLMRQDQIAKLRAVATSSPDTVMQNSGEGLIAEVGGLSMEGYGHAAAQGTTPEGYKADIGSPKFEGERAKNLRRAAQPRRLRVHIEEAATIEEEEENVVRALLEFFAGRHESGSGD